MKRFAAWAVILLLPALVIGAAQTQTFAGSAAPPARIATITPRPGSGAIRPVEDSTYPQTHDQPIHMPDLLGRSLDYAVGIWDDDEPLPQIIVEHLSDAPDVVVVRQQPEPGTMIVPEHTQVIITLDRGPVVRPPPTATPLPPLNVIAAPIGQATLLRAPSIQKLTTATLVIAWTTVEDGASEVQYGVGNTSLTALATSTFFTTPATTPNPYKQYYVHEATLTGLAPDTIYQYKIFTNGADLTPGGGVVTVRTAKPTTATRFRFAAVGDSGDGSQHQKDVATRLLQVQPDLVINTGDMIYEEATYDGLEKKFFEIYKDLIKSTWFPPTIGNHDEQYNGGKSVADMFVNPTNTSSDPAKRELYYSFDYGNAHFVVLNNYLDLSKTGSEQLNWLRNDLASTNQFWKFVVFHEPAYATNSNQQPRDNGALVTNVVPLFEQYGVDIVFQGHWHYYERLKPILNGQVSTVAAGGVVYIVTGGGGAGLFGIGTGTLHPRTAAKVSKYHLTLIDVDGCSLQLSAVQKVTSAGDTFDASDVFDTYTLDRCGTPPPPTNTPTATPTRTNTPGPSTATTTIVPSPTKTATLTSTTTTPTSTSTPTPTSTPTNTPSPTVPVPSGTNDKPVYLSIVLH